MDAMREDFETAVQAYRQSRLDDEPIGTPNYEQSELRDRLFILRTRHGYTLAVYDCTGGPQGLMDSITVVPEVREPRHGELSQAERERDPWRAAVLALAAYDDAQDTARRYANRTFSEILLDKVLVSVHGSTLVYDIAKDAIRMPTRDEMSDAELEDLIEEHRAA